MLFGCDAYEQDLKLLIVTVRKKSVADPGFHRGGDNPRTGGANLLFDKVFTENCMKMKEIGRRGVSPMPPPPDPPMLTSVLDGGSAPEKSAS